MKVKKITFVSDLEDIPDIFDYNLDVIVELEDGKTYTVVVGTPDNLVTLMDYEESNFLEPGDPIIIVRKITKEIVEEAIQAYAEKYEAYHLKFYSASLDTKTLDVLKDRYILRDQLLDDCLEKGQSIDIPDYNLIDFNIKNYEES